MLGRVLPAAVALAAAACARGDPGAFWHPGAEYRLVLATTSPGSLTPERERALAPVADTARLRLVVDSIARDTAYGRVEGDAPHFWVMFRAVGGDRFVAARDGRRWRLVLNPHATDTGLLLEGEYARGRVLGRWETRYSSPARGTFVLDQAT